MAEQSLENKKLESKSLKDSNTIDGLKEKITELEDAASDLERAQNA